MEVTLKTEVEAGASGFSVMGGGNDGIFIKKEKELSESIPEETLHVSGKATSEEDRETLIVSQRVGRSKRPKKDRLSWPKFQSIKNKKILGHRRSHSTSDAYEPAIQDISPTSTDTESQFQQEVPIKEKKGNQKKLKFPSIGFRMHRSKPETQDKPKKEIKTTLLSERQKIHKEDISLENPEILTVEYTTSPAYEIKTGEVKGLEVGVAKAELHTTPDTTETGEKQAEDETQIQKTKSGISMTKRKESETENSKLGSDDPHSVPEKRADKSSEDSRSLDVKPHMPDAESEVSTWKIQMPSFKITRSPKADMKIAREERTVDSLDNVKKEPTEEDGMHTSDNTGKMETGMKIGEKEVEGKEGKFRLPKLKLPTFTWATTRDETGQTESQKTRKFQVLNVK
ncbi:protein ahnak2- hypothetical protein [Limosa lapponica baueri]|uniref:Uncharacterized protein n=1 Tax=Limosa lapponica baueri TaxID=1758121 RepID=A0A2I0TPG6_LIMLA|nr:protein ahnak2- hypothetical protein [Limosa lapponica baueri]